MKVVFIGFDPETLKMVSMKIGCPDMELWAARTAAEGLELVGLVSPDMVLSLGSILLEIMPELRALSYGPLPEGCERDDIMMALKVCGAGNLAEEPFFSSFYCSSSMHR